MRSDRPGRDAGASAGLLDGGIGRADRGSARMHGAGAVGASHVKSYGHGGGADGEGVGGAVGEAVAGAVCAAPEGGCGDAGDNRHN